MLNKLSRKKITVVVRRKPQPVVLTGVALEIKEHMVAGLERCRQERAAFAATQERPAGTSNADWEDYLSGKLYELPSSPYPRQSIYQTTPSN